MRRTVVLIEIGDGMCRTIHRRGHQGSDRRCRRMGVLSSSMRMVIAGEQRAVQQRCDEQRRG
jgi:hypothetical protein